VFYSGHYNNKRFLWSLIELKMPPISRAATIYCIKPPISSTACGKLFKKIRLDESPIRYSTFVNHKRRPLKRPSWAEYRRDRRGVSRSVGRAGSPPRRASNREKK
jgi:hypothetical protein